MGTLRVVEVGVWGAAHGNNRMWPAATNAAAFAARRVYRKAKRHRKPEGAVAVTGADERYQKATWSTPGRPLTPALELGESPATK